MGKIHGWNRKSMRRIISLARELLRRRREFFYRSSFSYF